MAFCGGEERALEGDEAAVDPVEGVARPELQVGRHLIVAAAGGVELAAHVAQAVDERGLDVHVDVFTLEDERKIPTFDLGPDFGQPSHNLLAFIGGEQTHLSEHLGVGDRPLDVVLEEPTVKGDRLTEQFDPAVGFLGETTAPRLVGHPTSALRGRSDTARVRGNGDDSKADGERKSIAGSP